MEEKNKTNHYFISLPSQKKDEDIIDFEMRMLEQNHIRGLLPAAREYQDTDVKIYFDISGRQNLEQRYAWQKLTGRELRQILHTIAKVAAELEEYMLDYNHLNLMPEFIYGMLSPGDLCFCYEPWDSESFGERLRPLALWFLDHMDYREREEVIFSYEFQRFCEENDVSLALLGQFMAEKQHGKNLQSSGESVNMREEEMANAEGEVQGLIFSDSTAGEEQVETGDDFIWEEENSDTVRKKNGGMKEWFRRMFQAGERYDSDFSAMESLRFAEDETEYGRMTTRRWKGMRRKRAGEVLKTDDTGKEAGEELQEDDTAWESDEAPEKSILGELISDGAPALSIFEFPFFLGRDGELTDCEIADESVSRIHARLFLANGCVWVEDLRSKNGTFVNGDRMAPNEPWVLKDGDELKIGKCSWRFRRKNG